MNKDLETAQELLRDKKYDDCLWLLNTLALSANSHVLFNSLQIKGLCLFRMKKGQEAVQVYLKMNQIDPQFEDAFYRKGIILQSLNQWEQALAAFRETIAKNYMLHDCYYQCGVILQGLVKYEDALMMYDLSLKNKDQPQPEGQNHIANVDVIFRNKGVIFFQLKEFDMAIESLEQAIQLNDKNEKVFNTLGQVYQKSGNYIRAIDNYNKALRIKVNYPAAIINKGSVFRDQHKYTEAQEIYKQFLKVDSKNVDVLNELGQILNCQQQYNEAIKIFDQVISLDQNMFNAICNKSISLNKLNKSDQAIQCLNYVIQQDVTNLAALKHKGYILSELKKYDEAIDVYKQALLTNPKNADIYNNIGHLLIKKNNFQAGIQSFEKAISLNVCHVVAYTNKAQAHQMIGCVKQALIDLKTASNLLKDPLTIRQFSKENIEFIQDSVDKMIQLESTFQEQAQQLELAEMNINSVSAAQKGVLVEYRKLKTLKDDIQNREFTNFQEQNFDKHSPNKQQIQQNIELLQKLDELKRRFSKQESKMNKMEQIQFNHIIDQAQIQVDIKEIKDTLEIAGVYHTARIKQEWDKYNCDKYRTLYDYIKAFYWTLLNYFDAYRVASTGALKVNYENVETQIGKVASKLASSLPVIGGIMGMIFSTVDTVHSQVKQRKDQNRMNAILTILMTNQDPNAQLSEDQSRMLAMAALDIANRKRQMLEASSPTAADRKGSIRKSLEWIQQRVSEIQKLANLQEIKLYSQAGGKEALQDVILLLAYMLNEYEAIVMESKSKQLYLIISDAIMQKKTITAAENMKPDQRKTCECNLM